MPPKKTPVIAKEKTTVKKRKTSKENPSEDQPPKKRGTVATKEKATVKKGKTSKEKQTIKENPSADEPQKKKRTMATKGGRAKKQDNVAPLEVKNETQSDTHPKAALKKTQKRKTEGNGEPEPVIKQTKTSTRSNPTTTNWESVNFTCATKTSDGKSANFHIISWNIDGMRAWIRKGGLDLLKYGQPDILCLQETKCSEKKIPEEINGVDGYQSFWCSSYKEGYAGVGVMTKIKPLNVTYGIGSEEHDSEGRSITLEYENFFLINVYVPNSGRKLVTLPKRLDWNKAFKIFVKNLDNVKPVIICGDMNVAHKEIDLANPKTNTRNAGFTVEEREDMSVFLEDGYVDTFRELYPDKEKAYTFWTYMANARSKNVGWRLDYFIVSKRFNKNICDSVILNGVLGSDHCPIVLYFNNI